MNKPFKVSVAIKGTSFSGWINYLEDGWLQFIGIEPPYLGFQFMKSEASPLYICISNHLDLDRNDVSQKVMNDIFIKSVINNKSFENNG